MILSSNVRSSTSAPNQTVRMSIAMTMLFSFATILRSQTLSWTEYPLPNPPISGAVLGSIVAGGHEALLLLAWVAP